MFICCTEIRNDCDLLPGMYQVLAITVNTVSLLDVNSYPIVGMYLSQ